MDFPIHINEEVGGILPTMLLYSDSMAMAIDQMKVFKKSRSTEVDLPINFCLTGRAAHR